MSEVKKPLRFEVQADSVRSGVSKAGNKYTMQTVWVHTGDPYPHKLENFVRDKEQPLAAGLYALAPDAVYLTREGKLAVASRFVALPPAQRSA